MASRFLRTTTALFLALTVYFAASAPSARAAAVASTSSTQFQTIKFYFDPALVPDMAFAQAVLPKYVADMNTVLAKNTTRQLVFDPQTGIILTSTRPESGSAPSPMPTERFEIWVHVVLTTGTVSYGGYVSADKSGAGALEGMKWTRLYDPDQLASTEVNDYSTQVNTMLHELAHVFRAGIGEYYNLATITDTTGAEPLLDINWNAPGDPFWSDKQDFFADPLLRLSRSNTRLGFVAKAQYSYLTAAILNGDYRNGTPLVSGFTVQVLDQNAQPVPGAEVKVWNVVASSPYTSQLLFDQATDLNGETTFHWGGAGDPHNSQNMLRLVKVYQGGLPITEAHYVSVFDVDVAVLVNGQPSLRVEMRPADNPPTSVSLSNEAVDENQPAGTLVGDLSAVDPDTGDTVSLSFCSGPDDSAFQIDGSSLRTSAAFDFELRSQYSICVRADDGRGGLLDTTLTVNVNDVPDTTSAAFTSVASNDGWVLESGKGTNRGGSLNSGSGAFLLGNDSSNRRYRSVLAFNTADLPDDAIITKVTLTIRRKGGTSANPFDKLGNLVVDAGKPLIGSAAGLQTVDFQAQPGLASAGIFISKPDAQGWYAAQLNPSAFGRVNLAGSSQFRLRFSNARNTGADYVSIYSGNADVASRPTLVVEYELPDASAAITP